VLPCGSGKTIVGLAAIAAQGCETLIVTSNAASLQQWRDELQARTTVAPEAIGEYSSQAKEIRPITLTTYQMLTHRPRRDAGFPHLDLFERREWGLVIYDEVHLLPAPVFRATARIQARRRLGLTATPNRSCSRSSGPSATTWLGASSRTPAGSRAPSAPRSGSRSPRRIA
jgi:DNA excision repair protein ERCC-3